MNPNPYTPPLEPMEPPKVRGRFMTFIDFTAIIAALLPLLFLFWLAYMGDFEKNVEPLFDANVALAATCMLTILALYMASAVYNLVNSIHQRKIAFLGLFANFLTAGSWVLAELLF